MPKADVVFFADKDNISPALDWLDGLDEKIKAKFVACIAQLGEHGSTLKRPTAAPLRDKIYELRVRHRRVNYRLLYWFHAKGIAVLGHGCTKIKEVENADINRAIRQREAYAQDPQARTYRDKAE